MRAFLKEAITVYNKIKKEENNKFDDSNKKIYTKLLNYN